MAGGFWGYGLLGKARGRPGIEGQGLWNYDTNSGSVLWFSKRRIDTPVADIFISYSRQHPRPTRDVADYLKSVGYSVWYDTDLISGDKFGTLLIEN